MRRPFYLLKKHNTDIQQQVQLINHPLSDCFTLVRFMAISENTGMLGTKQEDSLQTTAVYHIIHGIIHNVVS